MKRKDEAMLPFDLTSHAKFSEDRVYRYTLERRWNDGDRVVFLMANPSTADETQDDPTIRRCIGFAKLWGYGALTIVNLYALRSTDPRELRKRSEPIGFDNVYWIRGVCAKAKEVILAWGCSQHFPEYGVRHIRHVLEEIPAKTPVSFLGFRKDGHPRHPLMLPSDTARWPWKLIYTEALRDTRFRIPESVREISA